MEGSHSIQSVKKLSILKMNNIEAKLKEWIELIQTEKLEGITENIQANVHVKNERVNRQIFKLLLYLSHTADKCNKENHGIGREIYKLTCLLCTILTDIPDNVKFVSSLFHIIRCLLGMYMYNEAHKVCLYLKDETCSHENVSDILVKIAYLWSSPINSEFLVLQKNSASTKHYHRLKNIINYEFEMIRIAYKNYTKQLLMKICSYLDKISLINKEPNCFADFSAFVIEYLGQIQIVLNTDEKYVICRHMLHISSKIMCENINENCLKTSRNILNSITKYFKKMLAEDEECYQCFLLFEDVCLTFIKSVECLTDSDTQSIQNLSTSYLMLAKKYEYTGSIKWTMFSIVQILESLFIYWESCIKTGKKMYLRCNMLLETLKLVGNISKFFLKQTFDKCKCCQSEDCKVGKDIYNVVVIKTRYINLISKFSSTDLSRDIFIFTRKFLEQNVALVYEMKECKCKCWTQLWCTNSALIYNLGIMSDCFYEESISLFSLLFTSFIQFEGIQLKSQYINLQNPISFILHRISSLHYNHAMYREAMTATALNALLSYTDPETKAFRMWANIKHKSVTSKEIMEMSILSCLKKDKPKIEELGIAIELSKYDLLEICLREAKGLQEAKVNLAVAIRKILNDMKVLKATPVQYARVVQMLVYHLLHFNNDEDNLEYVTQAITNLKQVKPSASVLCLQANLEFYIFMCQLRAINKKIQTEMESTKFALYAPKVNEVGENESRDVIPAYSMINIKEDSRLMTYLQVPLKKWDKCFRKNINQIAQECEPMITLHTLIIAGEYAHLYRYEECEVKIWKLVYALASKLQNSSAIIYATGRSVGLRHINHEWITTAQELAIKQEDSNDENNIYAIAIFWISLSDFYFECNMNDEGRMLLDKSRKLPGVSFFTNIAVYLYSLDRILYNCHLYKETIKHEEYTRYIVETLYTMVNLNEELAARKWKPQDKHLFGFDMLLSATVNLSLRMNSLLSFREIGAHLVRRLRTAQALGATIRVAEVLKSLCYIDLSRAQLNDCEIKLQGLEHILNIETFKLSMNSNPTEMCSEDVLLTPIRAVDTVRDVAQNDTSPVLKNKVFDLPDFMYHEKCTCYMCQNVSSHYLIFASTHIRAQLYALQKNMSASFQHFHGAFKIKEYLTKSSKFTPKYDKEYISWQERSYIIDYVLLLINFTYFMKSYFKTTEEKILSIISLAVKICDMYKLEGHPIHMAVRELMLDYGFQKLYDASNCTQFTVPHISNINISKYVQEPTVEGTICVTPTNNTRSKKPITLRRNRTPPFLKLTKVSMNFSDDEDIIPSSPIEHTSSCRKFTRRKILDKEYVDNQIEETDKSTNDDFDDSIEIKEENLSNLSMKDIIKKIASLAPDISEHLCQVVDKLDEPATVKSVQKLIQAVKSLNVRTASQKNVRKTRHSRQQILNNFSRINDVIALFKNFDMHEKKGKTELSGKNDVKSERNKGPTSSDSKDSLLCQKQSRISVEKDVKIIEETSLSINDCNKVDNIKISCTSGSSKVRITRKSTKHNTANKESHSIKTRKSKEKLV